MILWFYDLYLYPKTHSPCFKHFLKNPGEISQIHYHVHSLYTQIKKNPTYTAFRIMYCCLITLWLVRHIHAKRRWVKSSSGRLRDGEFQSQWHSRKILPALLFTPWKKISCHLRAPPSSYREMNLCKTRQARTRNPSRWRSECPGMEHASIPGSTSKRTVGAPWPPSLHIITSKTIPEWPQSLTCVKTVDSEQWRYHPLSFP